MFTGTVIGKMQEVGGRGGPQKESTEGGSVGQEEQRPHSPLQALSTSIRHIKAEKAQSKHCLEIEFCMQNTRRKHLPFLLNIKTELGMNIPENAPVWGRVPLHGKWDPPLHRYSKGSACRL